MRHVTNAELNAIRYLYGGGDETVECWSIRWVVTRFPHECYSIYHDGTSGKIPAGTRVLMERAKIDGRFGSCYTCNDCLNRAKQELRYNG